MRVRPLHLLIAVLVGVQATAFCACQLQGASSLQSSIKADFKVASSRTDRTRQGVVTLADDDDAGIPVGHVVVCQASLKIAADPGFGPITICAAFPVLHAGLLNRSISTPGAVGARPPTFAPDAARSLPLLT